MADAITVSCPSCRTAFPVDPEKVPTGGVNARCSECQDIFRVDEPAADVAPGIEEPSDVEASGTEDDLPGAGTPPGPEEAAVAVEEEPVGGGGLELEEPEVEVEDPEVQIEETAVEVEESEVAGGESELALGESEAEAEEAKAEAGEAEAEAGEEAAAFSDYFTSDEGAGATATEEAPSEEAVEPLPGLEEAGMEGPELEEPGYETPAIETEESGEVEAGTPEEPSVAEPISEEAATAEADEPATAEAEPAVDKPRPTFGNRSPEEKAQRLARVLVSDMITYNPTMYETALARGTLKEDFADEIDKSWEEYVEQVGEELANSTSHWTDALNDILAKGEQTF